MMTAKSMGSGALSTALLVGMIALGCTPEKPSTTIYPSNPALVIEVLSICDEGSIKLSFKLRNVGDDSIEIPNGVTPWDIDGMGTTFSAISNGRALKRVDFYPTVGQVGPLMLGPGDILSGSVSLDNIFDDFRLHLESSQILVHWKYWISRNDYLESRWATGTVSFHKGYCPIRS